MPRMWFSPSLKVINTTFYLGKFAVGTSCIAQIEVKRFNLELSGFRVGQELRWGLLKGLMTLTTSLDLTPEPSVPQSPTSISEQWGAWGWFPKTSWVPGTSNLKTPKWVILHCSHLPKLPLESPQGTASFRAHVYLLFPLLIISFTKSHCVPGSSRQALLGEDKTQVGFLCRLKFQKKKQCPDFCRVFANEKKPFFKPLWSPLSCSWDFYFSFSFLNVWLIKYCFRSWYSGMALKDERKIFISFFCLWIRMFYLKKVPSAGLLMSYYPLWK